MDFDTEIKDKLGTKKWKKLGTDSSGCISQGILFTNTRLNIVFKINCID